MSKVQILIEGSAAIDAAKEIIQLPEVTGEWQVQEDIQRDPATLAVIVAIAVIAGNSINIADKLHSWYKTYKENKAKQAETVQTDIDVKSLEVKTIDKVILVGANGKRLLLENATPEDVRKLLKALEE